MRKNKMMRAASGLLVATLLTTSVISGTFAKYTTSAEGTDTARVATWGFNDKSSITLSDLFKTAYDNNNVKSNVDVIAPGTTNEASFKFAYAGQETAPEVAYTFNVSTEGSDCDTDIKNNENIVWYLDGEKAPATTSGAKEGSWDALLAAIQALDGTDGETGATYQPGVLPTKFDVTKEHKVKWEWVYHTDENADGTDTTMANKKANDNGENGLDEVTLKITITAEQVD